jgi:hypothetical protein
MLKQCVMLFFCIEMKMMDLATKSTGTNSCGSRWD